MSAGLKKRYCLSKGTGTPPPHRDRNLQTAPRIPRYLIYVPLNHVYSIAVYRPQTAACECRCVYLSMRRAMHIVRHLRMTSTAIERIYINIRPPKLTQDARKLRYAIYVSR